MAEWLEHSTSNRKVAGSRPTMPWEVSGGLLSSTLKKMSWCILEGISPEIVHTASSGGDVKPSVPAGVLVSISIQFTSSSHLVSCFTQFLLQRKLPTIGPASDCES